MCSWKGYSIGDYKVGGDDVENTLLQTKLGKHGERYRKPFREPEVSKTACDIVSSKRVSWHRETRPGTSDELEFTAKGLPARFDRFCYLAEVPS